MTRRGAARLEELAPRRAPTRPAGPVRPVVVQAAPDPAGANRLDRRRHTAGGWQLRRPDAAIDVLPEPRVAPWRDRRAA